LVVNNLFPFNNLLNKNNMNSRFKFVGTGGIFDTQIGNSSAIVELDSGKLLLDCGYTVFGALKEKALVEDITYLLITHLHGDHVGSIHPLILQNTNKRKEKLKVLYPTEDFKNELNEYFSFFLAEPSDYIEFISLEKFPEIGFVDTKNLHVNGLQTFAYYFNFQEEFIFYSGDLGCINTTAEFLKNINHENITVFQEISFLEGKAHVYYKDLMNALSEYNVYAYHCNHNNAPNDCNLKFAANFPKYLV